MAWYNPASWFRRRKSIGEQKLMALLGGMGWNSAVNAWAANRHELLNQYRGWNYVAIHAFAEVMAEQTPQVAWVEDESAVKSQQHKIWFSGKNKHDSWRRDRQLSAYRSKFLGKMRRKKAMTSLQQGDELIPCPADDRLVRLLRKPNDHDTSWSFHYRLAMWLRLAGGVYLWLVPSNDESIGEIWVIPPNWLRPVGGKTGKAIEAWEMRPILGGIVDEASPYKWMMGGGQAKNIPADQIVSIGYPHPTHYFDFYSPLEAGSSWTDQSQSIGRARVAQFQNMSYPGVVLELSGDMEDPDQTDLERIKARFKAGYAGVMNRGEPVVLGPGMTLKPYSMTPVEMDFVNSDNQARDCLLALNRTGGSIVGLAEQTSFAAMIAARAHWYQGLIRPSCMLISNILTERVAPRFQEESDTRKRIIYYEDPTPTDPAQRLSEHQAYLSAGVISVNEARADIGKEPYPNGGDDPVLPMGVGPVPWVTGEEDEWLPPPAKEGGEGGAPDMGDEAPESGKSGAESISQLTDMFARGKHLNGKVHVEPTPALTKSDIEGVVRKAVSGITASVGSVADQLKAEVATVKEELADKTAALEKAITAIPRGKNITFKRDAEGLVIGVAEEVVS
jgi:phage portal protein BeeE